MVTGATSGIGEVTARALAQMGATVIVVSRSPEKSAATVEHIRQQTGNPAVEFMLADLSSQREIRRLAQQFKSCYQRLHVLVNNAGALLTTRQQSVDGIEMTFALNHLNYFLLTNLLLDTLQASTPARIVNVAAAGRLAIFCAHTNLDSAVGGVNDVLAGLLGLDDCLPLAPQPEARSWRPSRATTSWVVAASTRARTMMWRGTPAGWRRTTMALVLCTSPAELTKKQLPQIRPG